MTAPPNAFARALDRFWRKAGGPSELGHNELARASGLNPSLISRYLSGERPNPSRDSVERLVQGLDLKGLDADELYLSAGYVPDAWRDSSPAHLAAVMIAANAIIDPTVSEVVRARRAEVFLTLAQLWADLPREGEHPNGGTP